MICMGCDEWCLLYEYPDPAVALCVQCKATVVVDYVRSGTLAGAVQVDGPTPVPAEKTVRT